MKTKKEEFHVSRAQAIVVLFPKEVTASESLFNNYKDELRTIILDIFDYDIEDRIDLVSINNILTIQIIVDGTIIVGTRDFRGYLLDCRSGAILYTPDKDMINKMNELDTSDTNPYEVGNKFDLIDPAIVDDNEGVIRYLIASYINDSESLFLPVGIDEKGHLFVNVENGQLKGDESK